MKKGRTDSAEYADDGQAYLMGAKKENTLSRFFGGVPEAYRAQFEAHRLRTNVSRMYFFSIYVVGLQIALNLINIVKPDGGQDFESVGGAQIPILYYVALSAATFLLGIIYWALFLAVKKGKISSRDVQAFLVESFIYLYIAIQLAFCTMNIVSAGGVNSYIIAILILGLVPVVRPAQSLVSILASFAYVGIAMYLLRDVSQAWNLILVTDQWTNLIIITGLTICISKFIYDMYRSNFLQSVSLERTNQELEQIATTDQMTGVANRYALSRSFNDIWLSSAARNARLAVAIVDIDFFKAYNDKFGHLEGDKCLQRVAQSLQASFRRGNDIVSRYGGEEFLIVFEAGGANAFELVENARKAVEAMGIAHARKDVSDYVTISAGLCLVSPSPELTTNAALKIADDALYESKQTGRNKTTQRLFAGAPQAS
ncbi:MAG: GGDEF domain-containing protein [Clostridiales bacterium]|nr:GGDEF domain-containing protein [Clostridiales bacterium]